MTPRVAAVVPVIDEEAAIRDVVLGLRRAGSCCVIVVDGGSRDRTREIARGAGAIVIVERQRGYGRACRSGAEAALAGTTDQADLRAANRHQHEIVAFLDGDGSCDPDDLRRLVDAAGDADVVLGRRPRRLIEPGAMPWHARLGNAFVTALVAGRTGRPVHDLPPYKALRRAALERLDLDDDSYGWTTQLVARAVAEPMLRIAEVPVRFRRRVGGTSKVSGSWRTSLRAGRAMIARALSETASRPVLGLMAKAPGRGAKTRLAAEIGDRASTSFWSACLADTAGAAWETVRGAGVTPIVVLPAASDEALVSGIIGPGWFPLVQSRPGLPSALVDVFLTAFDRGADRAIAVAGDAPGLPPSRILTGLSALERATNASVIGPTSDGGYHLVGLRWRAVPRWWPDRLRQRRRRRLDERLRTAFATGPTAGTSAFEVTLGELASGGWRVTTVKGWPDVDTLADLRALARRLAVDDRWAPRTTAWLAAEDAWRPRYGAVDSPTSSGGSSPGTGITIC